jgi:hypothetical protein
MRRLGVGLVAGLSLIAGCTSTEVLVAHSVALQKNTAEIPEAQLLDVGVSVFDSGVPEGEVDKDVLEHLIKEGTFVQIRRSESLYMSVLLRNTLQKSKNWGSVWVTPKDSSAADLSVDGKILHSDGDYFQLHVKAVDATGHIWIDKKYEMSTAAGAFNRQRYPDLDPYQDVFNEVANDLAKARGALSAKDTQNIRRVAGLRYAADVSPDAFGKYVVENKGRYEANRLPAEGDPMYDRTERVRQRERLFLDTLDQHYDQYYKDATKPYNGWRENARAESIEVKEATKTAHWRTGIGVASIVASIVYGSNHGSDFAERMLRDTALFVGMELLRTARGAQLELRRPDQAGRRRNPGNPTPPDGHRGRAVSGVARLAAADLHRGRRLRARGSRDLRGRARAVGAAPRSVADPGCADTRRRRGAAGRRLGDAGERLGNTHRLGAGERRARGHRRAGGRARAPRGRAGRRRAGTGRFRCSRQCLQRGLSATPSSTSPIVRVRRCWPRGRFSPPPVGASSSASARAARRRSGTRSTHAAATSL